MAIGPEQLNDNFKEEVDNFEKYIDLALSTKSFKGSNKVYIDTPRGITNAHSPPLVERYLKAGWKSVRREYGDQRDPCDMLIFEK